MGNRFFLRVTRCLLKKWKYRCNGDLSCLMKYQGKLIGFPGLGIKCAVRKQLFS